MILPVCGIDRNVAYGVSAMYHHAVPNIDSHMGNAGGVVSTHEKHKVAGFRVCRRNRGADVI